MRWQRRQVSLLSAKLGPPTKWHRWQGNPLAQPLVLEMKGMQVSTTQCQRWQGNTHAPPTALEREVASAMLKNGSCTSQLLVWRLAWRSDERQLHVGGMLAEAALSLPVVNSCRQAGRAAVPCLWPYILQGRLGLHRNWLLA